MEDEKNEERGQQDDYGSGSETRATQASIAAEFDDVYGFAQFEGWEGEHWTDAERAPIVAVLHQINDAACVYWQLAPTDRRGINHTWCFRKQPLRYGAPYVARLSTWRGDAWHAPHVHAIAERLHAYYASLHPGLIAADTPPA